MTGKGTMKRRLADVAQSLPTGRQPRIIVLAYHAITADEQEDPEQLTVSRRRFADQMRWLKDLGYPVVPLRTAAAQLTAGTVEQSSVVLTFDDGYRSFYENAVPVLLEHGYPATMFLVPGAMNGQPHEGLPERLGPLLDWSQARELVRSGIVAGAHGMTHRKLALLPAEAARREVVDSTRALEDGLGVKVEEFCYPYGSFDAFSPAIECMVRDLGFGAVCANIAGLNVSARDVFRLKRLRISWVDDSQDEMRKQCAGAYNWYAFVQRAQSWRQRLAAEGAR
jgi:peptidoglycan/xylan/chitin deacetylase (PgdA/CDA1 family)